MHMPVHLCTIASLPFCFKMCIFQHNAAVIVPNMVILTMYSAMKQPTTPVKTVDRNK